MPFEYATIDMQVLMKADGLPTYHLANVVDDHLMEITHVIRGEEWLPSAPKHLLLYGYFGWEAPTLMHLPLLRNPDKSKLSKRKNPTGILFYQRMGYLPEALLNFLGLLISPAAEGEEVFDVAALTARLDLAKMSLGGPVFDVAKLDWLNGKYLREISTAELIARTRSWGFDRRADREDRRARPRAGRAAERHRADGGVSVRRPDRRSRPSTSPARSSPTTSCAGRWRWRCGGSTRSARSSARSIDRVLKGVGESLGRKFRDLARVYYVAMTGCPTSLPLFESMELLGRDIVRERFRVALDVLGGVSAKEQKWSG